MRKRSTCYVYDETHIPAVCVAKVYGDAEAVSNYLSVHYDSAKYRYGYRKASGYGHDKLIHVKSDAYGHYEVVEE